MTSKVNLKYLTVFIIIIMLTTVLIAYINRKEIVWVRSIVPIDRVNVDKKVVAIACNVYEGNEEIEKILKTLEQKNVKITFFLGGVWANKNPETVKLIYRSGHDIQNHGYYHKLPTTLNQAKNIQEIKDTEKIIYNLTGTTTNLFEPPSGDYDENTLSIANSLNYRVVTWSIDTIDWRKDATKDLILSRIKRKLHPGGIILTHPKQLTAESMPEIIDMLKDNGYEITTVTELLKYQ